jgi:hypothetical protein
MKITKNQVSTMVKQFDALHNHIAQILNLIQNQMTAKMASSNIISADEADAIHDILVPVRAALREYTENFPSYLRSVGKTTKSGKPDPDFLGRVRDVLYQARELEDDLIWQEKNCCQQIALHNMSLGAFKETTLCAPSEPLPQNDASADTVSPTGTATGSDDPRHMAV